MTVLAGQISLCHCAERSTTARSPPQSAPFLPHTRLGGSSPHTQSSILGCALTSSITRRPLRALRQPRLLVQAGRVPVGEKWWERSSVPNMREVSGVQQFVDELATAQDRLVIVDFFARCIAEDNPDILVLKVEWDDNREICKALGIKVLPYFQFYRGTLGKVAEFSASVSKIQRIRDALAEHNTPRCDLGKVQRIKEFPEVEPQLISYPSDGKDGGKNPARQLVTA
ncbi:hypothetical protein WJX84_007454 [Apatococcus fuscideae]|uniref:Thioredoxin domain-containing protein n=1 Tax=Apatococcus fuscideae TaxID=2026836 RepID=A0AAW1TKE2_9CHLO